MKPGIISRLAAVATLLFLLPNHLTAQSSPVELTELSLEELLDVRVVPTEERNFPGEFSWVQESGWQVRYRYLYSFYKDYLDGTHRRSAEEVLTDFPVSPNRITQEAHVVNVSRRVNPDLTLLVEASYVLQSTDHIRRSGDPFTIRTSGMGDARISGIYRIVNGAQHKLFLSGGGSLPVGSIDEKGDTPRGMNTQVPYTMQNGSGTVDLSPGITYFGQSESWRWGAEMNGKLRLGRNDRDYSLGDRMTISGWLKCEMSSWFNPVVKIVYTRWGRIDGRDHEINPDLAPVADSSLFGGSRLNLMAGAEIHPQGSALHQIRIGIEGGIPVYQDLNGPQPRQQWQLALYAAKAF